MRIGPATFRPHRQPSSHQHTTCGDSCACKLQCCIDIFQRKGSGTPYQPHDCGFSYSKTFLHNNSDTFAKMTNDTDIHLSPSQRDRSPGPQYAILLSIVLYLLTIALLRKHRLRSLLETFPYTSRRSFASMTLEHAFHIQLSISTLEFPFTFQKAMQFALFRTYGIPTISKLLVQTSELTKPATASKRYVDTEVLVSEFSGYHPQSDRAVEAMARMNYIHSHYQRSGKITNDDMLYTLSLFALEPIRWIRRYEWRELEDFERCAIGTFWKATGDAMAIDYGCLRSVHEGWLDGLQWLEEVEAWAEAYEERSMVPDINNHKTADETTALLLWYVPQWAKSHGQKIVCALMDDRLRAAMM